MTRFEIKYDLMLKKDLFQLYEDKLINEFGLNLSNLSGYKKEIAPIVYTSILNKKITPKPRRVILSEEFSVPSEFEQDWQCLKSKIESGQDVSMYMSKGLKKWNKTDYLLFSCNVVHLHFRSDGNRGILNELVFGVVDGDNFYALSVGGHEDLYRPDELLNIAESNWPGELFRTRDTNKIPVPYDRELALDQEKQFNQFVPLGVLDGPQHTTICTLMESDGEIKNVPIKSFCAYENELLFLKNIENKLAEKHGADIRLKLEVDFVERKYKVKLLDVLSTPYKYSFSSWVSCSGIASEHHI